jgi:hypothetical protein
MALPTASSPAYVTSSLVGIIFSGVEGFVPVLWLHGRKVFSQFSGVQQPSESMLWIFLVSTAPVYRSVTPLTCWTCENCRTIHLAFLDALSPNGCAIVWHTMVVLVEKMKVWDLRLQCWWQKLLSGATAALSGVWAPLHWRQQRGIQLRCVGDSLSHVGGQYGGFSGVVVQGSTHLGWAFSQEILSGSLFGWHVGGVFSSSQAR